MENPNNGTNNAARQPDGRSQTDSTGSPPRRTRSHHSTKGKYPNPSPDLEKAAASIPVVVSEGLTPEQIEVENVVTTPGIPGPIRDVAAAKDKEATATALIILALLDGLAVAAVGEGASMRPNERLMMSGPLERILQRMDLKANEVLNKWTDPVLFTMGLMAWGLRISREAEKKPKPAPIPTPAPAPVPENKNGKQPAPEPAPFDLGLITQAPPIIGNNFRREGIG